jgi:hypothetical protein
MQIKVALIYADSELETKWCHYCKIPAGKDHKASHRTEVIAPEMDAYTYARSVVNTLAEAYRAEVIIADIQHEGYINQYQKNEVLLRRYEELASACIAHTGESIMDVLLRHEREE